MRRLRLTQRLSGSLMGPMLVSLMGLTCLAGLHGCQDKVRLKVKVRTADAGMVTTSTTPR